MAAGGGRDFWPGKMGDASGSQQGDEKAQGGGAQGLQQAGAHDGQEQGGCGSSGAGQRQQNDRETFHGKNLLMVQGCLGDGEGSAPLCLLGKGGLPGLEGMAGPVGPVPTQGGSQTQQQGQDQRGQGVEHLLPCQGEEQSGQSSQGGGHGQGGEAQGFLHGGGPPF